MAKFENVEEYLAALDEPLREVAKKARSIIDAALPDINAALWHGDPTWSQGKAPGKNPLCLLKAYSSYVTFAFWRGQKISDPSGRLAAGAREMAHVKLRGIADIDAAVFTDWLHQAQALEIAELKK